jgi:hypothetical protein
MAVASDPAVNTQLIARTEFPGGTRQDGQRGCRILPSPCYVVEEAHSEALVEQWGVPSVS